MKLRILKVLYPLPVIPTVQKEMLANLLKNINQEK